MIDRIGGGKGVDVNRGGRQLAADPRQSTRPVPEKDGELSGGLDLNVGIHKREDAPARAG